jgi:hypothetical protein
VQWIEQIQLWAHANRTLSYRNFKYPSKEKKKETTEYCKLFSNVNIILIWGKILNYGNDINFAFNEQTIIHQVARGVGASLTITEIVTVLEICQCQKFGGTITATAFLEPVLNCKRQELVICKFKREMKVYSIFLHKRTYMSFQDAC